ncbi:MAG: alpha-2-macroglobulin family protein [Anaerolineaceae bacterium]|nr:alpha-2-macroglobulin family protein [Anaerolineaceae bacterium]
MAHSLLQFIQRRRILVILGVIVLLLASTGVFLLVKNPPVPTTHTGQIPIRTGQGSGNQATSTGGPSGMQTILSDISIRLSQGQAQPRVFRPVPLATGEPLSPEEVAQIMARLPALIPEAGDQADFRLPGDPIPPPRPGQTSQQAFPPTGEPATPGQVESGPLKVLRFSPEGEVPVAPFLSVTFNQPMAPLATLAELSEAQVPVQLDPPLPGKWRWLGTRTLTFQYDSALIDRLPKATEYHARVPAGVRALNGSELAEAVEWSFTTPAPEITGKFPEDQPQPLDPLFFIHFDQRIDPAAVLDTVRVTAGTYTANLRLVAEAELREHPQSKSLLDGAVDGRWIAFRAMQPLPADSAISVTVGPGTPSAEGPLTTKEAKSFSFRTYAALRVTDHGCYWGNNQCVPLSPFFIQFNNPIDAKAYKPEMLSITPELPGASIDVIGNSIQIQGASQGQTDYTVTVRSELQDIFGQKLGEDNRLVFHVGPAEPTLFATNQPLVTLDPASKKTVFSVYAINYPRLDVKIYAVQPADWLAYKQFLIDYRQKNAQTPAPGRLIADKTIPVEAAADTLTEVDIDLSAGMDGAFGHWIVMVSPPENLVKEKQNLPWQTIITWVQVTQIGLDAYNDHSEMVVWASALKDGAPLAGITVQAQPTGQQFITGADGTARAPIPNGAFYLVASRGADTALLLHTNYQYGDEAWQTRPVSDELHWFVFDDRQMYRPGEEVHVKGWLRRIGGKQDGDVGLVDGAVSAVDYRINDSQGNVIGNGQAAVNPLGGFNLIYKIPDKVNLGYTYIQMDPVGNLSDFGANNHSFTHNFQIQEFRRPEFEVIARNETTGPYFTGGSAVTAVEAKYYAGGALPNADVSWQVTSSPGHYAPPNWPEFSFGEWTPWWSSVKMAYGEWGAPPPGGDTKIETFTGKTDPTGQHFLRLDFTAGGDMKPVSITAQASVMDVNRQAWASVTTLLVHPASIYVGLRSSPVFVERGAPIRVDFIVTDLDGKPVVDRPVEVSAARLDWQLIDGTWQEVEVDPQTCNQGSTTVPATCTFQTPVGGSYKITALVTDPEGRKNRSSLTRWVSGGKLPPQRTVQQETLTLIPDKEIYQPGEVAHILVQAPFGPAEGLMTLNRNGIVSTQRFQVAATTVTLDVPIEESYIPNLNVQVDVNGSAPRTDDQGNPIEGAPARPAFATGQLSLSIPPLQRTLALQVTPRETEIAPGGETTLDLLLKDAGGRPVADAELAVVVVDEAVLALSGYQMADPIKTFYADSPLDLTSNYARSTILLANPETVAHQADESLLNRAAGLGGAAPAQPAAAPTQAVAMEASMADKGATQNAAPIPVRTDFNPLAVFSPAVHTGADGQASLAVKVPDNLTRYRVMVVAVDAGKRFGLAEANLTARLPLMVRPSAPRFLNFGDRFELPIVLQNQTGEAMDVSVAVRAANLTLTTNTGLRVTVPANDRLEVRFPATTELAGVARLQIAAVAGSYADAATIDLPVYTPATTEAFATYGVIDQGSLAQPVSTPKDVFAQYGGLEISTSSTALQALTDAVLYLVAYPYDCTEQIASRILAVSALRDVLTAFKAEGLPAPQEMEAAVQRDIQTLKGLQNDDGGFPYWRRGSESIPFNTIHVAHAIYRAQSKGFSVPADVQQRTLEYLRSIEDHYPSYYSEHTRRTLSAYALFVRNLMGDGDPRKAEKLMDAAGLDGLSPDAIGWLWPVIGADTGARARLDEIRRYVDNHTVETAGAANFTTSYDDQNYLLLASDRRTDAILLDALIADSPQNDLIPKLVNGLLAHRTSGRWGNTQENVFVLLSLDRYFNTFEAQTPDFVARIWLGQNYAGSQEFRGRSTGRNELDIPMTFLVDPNLNGGGSAQDLILSKDGPGRLYFRLGLRYAPTNLEQAALDMGFVVQRVYEAVDDPGDVRQDENGVWRVKAGARVRVHLTMEADNRRYHVALVDPLPAGLEIVNPDLDVSGSLPPDDGNQENRRFWWWGPWYQHQNLRDERAEAFTSLLWEGVYQYTYVARATTPGTFVVPPAKAEEMYSPEVFGRSASNVVIVE